MGAVKVELRVIPNCPGADKASTLLRTALDDIGFPELRFVVRVVESDAAAQALGFAGSPAFVLDGTDIFETEGTGGSMACRVYATPDGPRNVPALSDLRLALKRRLDGLD